MGNLQVTIDLNNYVLYNLAWVESLDILIYSRPPFTACTCHSSLLSKWPRMHIYIWDYVYDILVDHDIQFWKSQHPLMSHYKLGAGKLSISNIYMRKFLSYLFRRVPCLTQIQLAAIVRANIKPVIIIVWGDKETADARGIRGSLVEGTHWRCTAICQEFLVIVQSWGQ